ncbi:hypothetical protein C4J85_5205 [Pseudomonas sp. R4-34-07]|nr:hypothetical protein C4J85_5205 [Pseudomonas sp. R4-34-07]
MLQRCIPHAKLVQNHEQHSALALPGGSVETNEGKKRGLAQASRILAGAQGYTLQE